MSRMSPTLCRGSSALLILFLCIAAVATAQGRGNILFGDVNIDDSKVSGLKPETFYIILYTSAGSVFARQAVSSNSRYKFLSVPNGQYDLVIEVENQVVGKIPLVIREVRPTDIRRDLNLEWSEGLARTSRPVGTVAAVEAYARPAASQAKFDRALEEERKKNYEPAMTLLREILRDDARDYIAWTELGTLQFKQEDWKAAALAYLRALEARPNFLLALVNLGKLRMAQKNYDSAIEVLTRAVQTPPPSAEANHLLGECYLQIRKGSKAVGYLNEAIKLDPVSRAGIHLRLAALYHAAGMKDRAVAEYEKLLEKLPDHPERKKLQKYISEHKK